jgi:hypothetical protein
MKEGRTPRWPGCRAGQSRYPSLLISGDAADHPGMAGLSGHQTVVDVVAASEALRPSAATSNETAFSLEVGLSAPTEVGGPRCALGHDNQPGARFCAGCGLPMDAEAPQPGVVTAARPKPDAELSDAERAERERQHAAAVAAAARFERAEPTYVPTEGEAVLIHFVADGFTAFGQVWFRGQEMEIGPDHPRWAEARRWITLSRFEQVERYGEQKFDFGPWPGRPYADAAGSFERLMTGPRDAPVPVPVPSAADLAQAQEAERRRNRAVPMLNFT